MPSAASTTSRLVRPERRIRSALSWCGARCWTRTIANPGSRGRALRSCENASRPPAEAPTPTTTRSSSAGLMAAGLRRSFFRTTRRRDGAARFRAVVFFFAILAAGLLRTLPSAPRSRRAYRRAGCDLAIARQQRADDLGLPFALLGMLHVAAEDQRELPEAGPMGHPPAELGLLLEGADGGPERLLHAVVLAGHQALHRQGVAHVAAETGERPIADVPERAAAVGAGERGERPSRPVLVQAVRPMLRDARALGFAAWHASSSLRRLARELGDDRRHLAHPEDVVDRDAPDRAPRHALHQRVLEILRDRDATMALDRLEPGGAVVERAGEDDADHARALAHGRRAEERVDGRPEAILARATRHADGAVVEQEVMVRRRDVDASVREGLTVDGVRGRQRSGTAHHGGQGAGTLRGAVDGDEESRGQLLRKPAGEIQQSRHPSRRSANHHDVPGAHHRLLGVASPPGQSGTPLTSFHQNRGLQCGQRNRASVTPSSRSSNPTCTSRPTRNSAAGTSMRFEIRCTPPASGSSTTTTL